MPLRDRRLALLTIVIVPLLYPVVDVATWQRLAALAKDTRSEPDLRSLTLGQYLQFACRRGPNQCSGDFRNAALILFTFFLDLRKLG